MSANERIKAERMRLGLTAKEVADRIGMTIHEYEDVEQHADELHTAVELHTVKRLFEILGLDLFELLGFPSENQSNIDPSKKIDTSRKHEVLREKRESLNLNRADLAEQLGFEEAAIAKLEDDPDAVEHWPVDLVIKLAERLQLPPRVLLS